MKQCEGRRVKQWKGVRGGGRGEEDEEEMPDLCLLGQEFLQLGGGDFLHLLPLTLSINLPLHVQAPTHTQQLIQCMLPSPGTD